MTQPLANRFADYSCRLRFEDLPPACVHETKRRFIDSFATNNLSQPFGLRFGPDGSLYVVSGNDNSVERFNGTNGTFLNKKPVSTAVALRKGDRLQVGKTVLELTR